MESYWEKLKDPRWQRKRLEMLDSAGWQCEDCGAEDQTLHVHHKRYIKGRAPWEYSPVELSVLCDACHVKAHDTKSRLDAAIALSGLHMQGVGVGLVAGYAVADDAIDFDSGMSLANRHSAEFEAGVAAWCLSMMPNDAVRFVIRNYAQTRAPNEAINRMIASWDFNPSGLGLGG